MFGSHIHTPDDGRGRRQVLVDGRPVKRVVYADTRRGLVRYHNDPPKVHKHGKRFIEKTRRGTVEVLPL
ncbi:hypothetical protein P2B08_17705 [Xanthomonas perforans]|uniref:hypothetical protein n=1 Tax=Xanthomonas perforans TaxID=442694 RepID=UPI000D6876B4|nr:hypothetical protein [Xanthomonas perforans]PWH21639.1 hypothetical protein CDO09_19990 [Xanthomonas perforans]